MKRTGRPEREVGDRGQRPLGRGELLAILGFWTFMALLGAANEVVDPDSGPARWAGSQPIISEFFEAYLWAALTPVIFWLSGRLRIERSHWVRPAILLAAVGLGCAVFADVVEDVFEIQVLGASPSDPGTSPLQSLLRLWFLNDLMIFVAVLAAGFAREYFFRYRDRQEQAVELQARAAVLEAQLSDARLEALRMQVNPHFLFNTLHAVSSLVQRDPDGVRRMIAKLAALLRTTLSGSSSPEVPLEAELEFLEDYLDIMGIRFQGRLEVDFEIQPGLLGATVPNLILQPLVENAVKHGLGETDGPAAITVTGAAHDDVLVLAVLDTGPGVPPDLDLQAAPGIGLRNVRDRLRQLYGDDASLRVEAREGGGTRAEVRLPLLLPAGIAHRRPGTAGGAADHHTGDDATSPAESLPAAGTGSTTGSPS